MLGVLGITLFFTKLVNSNRVRGMHAISEKKLIALPVNIRKDIDCTLILGKYNYHVILEKDINCIKS